MNKLGGLVGRNYRQIWQSSCWFRLNLYVPRTHVPLILNQQKWTILYECTDGSLICSMVYKILGKFDLYMFCRQLCRILEWKPFNGIQGAKEGLIWALARFTQHKLGWFWTWWMVWYHFSFILYWWYIVLCFEKKSLIYISLDKAVHVNKLKDKDHVLPRKFRFGWRMVECPWFVEKF